MGGVRGSALDKRQDRSVSAGVDMTHAAKRKPGRPRNPNGRLQQKSVRLTADQWKSVDAAAKELDRSQSWIISACVQASLAQVIVSD